MTSMTEEEYIAAMAQQMRTTRWATKDSFELLQTAFREHPHSARLWLRRGIMIQLGDEDCEFTLDDALLSFQKAIALDPSYGQAYEKLGYFYDKILDKPEEAEPYFRKAIALGRGEEATDGLNDVLEQLGKKRES